MLKIEHLTKIFGKGTINEMTALNDVNFHAVPVTSLPLLQ